MPLFSLHRYIDTTSPQLSKSEISTLLAIFCGCRARFMSNLVGNSEDRFSRDEAQMYLVQMYQYYLRQRFIKTLIGNTLVLHSFIQKNENFNVFIGTLIFKAMSL